MPTAVIGNMYRIKNIGAGTITVQGVGGTDTIDGSTTQLLYTWEGIFLECSAANTWVVI
jgi:hypothetical protein